ncbi:MAG: polysaccharide deacetylase family protein [Rhodoplanes sp.]
MKGKLTISVDLELAWGVWDQLTLEDLRMAETAERPICAALLELFDRHSVPATWAMVAALLDEPSAKKHPGPVSCWYAPDIVEQIVRAKTAHEIGSHGGRHIDLAAADARAAEDDLLFAKHIHRSHALPFQSLVFPRNRVGNFDAVARAGLRVYRGRDVGWTSAAHRAGRWAAKAANLADKALPIPPPSVTPQARAGLIDVPGSMLLIGRNGARRFVLPAVTRAKLSMGLRRAMKTGEVFHLWFHPSNFYYRRQEQLDTLAWFLELAAEQASHGRIEIATMGSYAPSPPSASQDGSARQPLSETAPSATAPAA